MPESRKKVKIDENRALGKKILGKKILVVDCREAGEPMTHVLTVTNETPSHMRRQLLKDINKFEFVYFADGAESLQGLVDEESEIADERADEVADWLESMMDGSNKADFPLAVPVDYYISIIEA
jgi:hypothetical protein